MESDMMPTTHDAHVGDLLIRQPEPAPKQEALL